MRVKMIFSLFVSMLVAESAMAMPAQVLIIRHGEKPTPEGRELSEKGFARARALVNYFKTDPDVTQHGTPVAIYAMKPKDENGAIRAIQTVTPLANALHQELIIEFKKDEFKGIVNQIQSTHAYDGKMVLICWEHKAIPDLAVEFGVKPRPADWDGADFSTVYEINFEGDKVSKFRTYPEKLSGLLR